ncbi:hypothetical protein E8E11_005638 [Didymella keratinophila]|nr:hypothetical protein E8E11_005638 [Didymella keratinophila]
MEARCHHKNPGRKAFAGPERTKDLQNTRSDIRKVSKRQYEDMFFKKDKIEEQLATRLKGSVTKALIDESLKGTREDIDDLKKLTIARLVILAQTREERRIATEAHWRGC